MLGLAQSFPEDYRSAFISFAEGGRCAAFVDEMTRHGFEARALTHDTPHFRLAIRELAGLLQRWQADVLCCHGYKADLLGRLAARRQNVPVVAVSRGWTGESFKVRVYEALDRIHLRWMDRVVCVSACQAQKVRRAGVAPRQIAVLRNAIQPERFDDPDPAYRALLHGFFGRPRRRIVGAAGRLSPEKGFAVLVEAARRITQVDPSVGFVLFGDGPLREALSRQVAAGQLTESFVLTGYRRDLDRFLPFLDLLALPSFTEGLPNVVLEALAAGVPVVASAVGGTPEVVADGFNGYLVPPGDPLALARRILDTLASDTERQAMGLRGRQQVLEEYTFNAQAFMYQQLFEDLVDRPRVHAGGRGLAEMESVSGEEEPCLRS